jgi:hypothetical protein
MAAFAEQLHHLAFLHKLQAGCFGSSSAHRAVSYPREWPLVVILSTLNFSAHQNKLSAAALADMAVVLPRFHSQLLDLGV